MRRKNVHKVQKCSYVNLMCSVTWLCVQSQTRSSLNYPHAHSHGRTQPLRCSQDRLSIPNLILQIYCTFLRERKDFKHLPCSRGGDFIVTSIDIAFEVSYQASCQTLRKQRQPWGRSNAGMQQDLHKAWVSHGLI